MPARALAFALALLVAAPAAAAPRRWAEGSPLHLQWVSIYQTRYETRYPPLAASDSGSAWGLDMSFSFFDMWTGGPASGKRLRIGDLFGLGFGSGSGRFAGSGPERDWSPMSVRLGLMSAFKLTRWIDLYASVAYRRQTQTLSPDTSGRDTYVEAGARFGPLMGLLGAGALGKAATLRLASPYATPFGYPFLQARREVAPNPDFDGLDVKLWTFGVGVDY